MGRSELTKQRGRLSRAQASRGLLQAAFVVAVLGLPLMYASLVSHPFVSPKLLALGLAAALTVAGGLLAEAPQRRLARGTLLALCGVVLLSALSFLLAARTTGEAWWGRDGQYVGWLVMIYSLLMYVLGTLLSTCCPSLEPLPTVLLATGIPLLVLAAWQMAKLPLPLGLPSASGFPVATLGHPHLLGAFLAALVPLTLVNALNARHRRAIRAGLLLLALGCVAGVIRSGSPAPWAGLLAGATVALALVAPSHRRWYVVMGGAVVGCLLLVLYLVLPHESGLWQSLCAGGLAGERLQVWRIALGTIGRSPLLGVGPAGFLDAFLDALTPQLVDTHFARTSYADAHNWILELAATCGVPCLLALLYLLLKPFRAAGRLDPERKACLGALAALLVSYLFMPLALSTLPLVFLLAGLASRPAPTTAATAAPPAVQPKGSRSLARAVVAVLLPLVVLFPSFEFLLVDARLHAAQMAEDVPGMLQAARQLTPALPAFYYPIGEQLAFNANAFQDADSAALINPVFTEAAALNSHQPQTFFQWGLMLQIADLNHDALLRFDDTLSLYPNLPNALKGKSVSLLELGRNQEAADILQPLHKRHPDDAAAAELLNRALEALRTE